MTRTLDKDRGMERETERDEELFEADGFGSLQDIVVGDTDSADWQRVLDFLGVDPLRLTYSIDGVPADLPTSIAEVFSTWQQAAPALLIDVEGVRLGCYFFDSSEIEFDFDPRDVKTDDQRSALLAFMQALADLRDKPVFVAPEGSHAEFLHRVAPMSHAVA